jgi:hypothetical protein
MTETMMLLLIQARAMKGQCTEPEWHDWICHSDGTKCDGGSTCVVDTDRASAYSKAYDGDDCACSECEPELYAERHHVSWNQRTYKSWRRDIAPPSVDAEYDGWFH